MSDPAPPRVLPVFPLSGCLLLPGNYLPLNVFERRYRNMVEDLQQAPPYIGMIQPRAFLPGGNGQPRPESLAPHPDLYPVGCAGRLEECERQPDGRYYVVLRGVSRFRVVRELPLRRGYRRVVAEYGAFAQDLKELEIALDPTRMLAALHHLAEEQELEFDMELLRALPGVSLLNGLCAALPFAPEEKQALLEAEGPMEREELLLDLLGVDSEPLDSEEELFSPPTVH